MSKGTDDFLLQKRLDQCESSDHLRDCTDDDCELCELFLDFCMACEGCGHWGQMDSDGWKLFVGMPFCLVCAEDPKIYKPGPLSVTAVADSLL